MTTIGPKLRVAISSGDRAARMKIMDEIAPLTFNGHCYPKGGHNYIFNNFGMKNI